MKTGDDVGFWEEVRRRLRFPVVGSPAAALPEWE